MKNTEALEVILRSCQRRLTPIQIDEILSELREFGVSDEQIRTYGCEYFVANSVGWEE